MSARCRPLDLDTLRALLAYDAETGVLTWRAGRSGGCRPGAPAGNLRATGYRAVRIDGVLYRAHRLIWFLVHGEWPRFTIDHINGNRGDNRIVNLRDVPEKMNNQNRRAASKRKYDAPLGVRFDPRWSQWSAAIKADGRTIFLGNFKTPAEAHARYVAEKRLRHPGCTL